MKFSMQRLAACAIACAMLACVAGAARAADDYPSHPVRWLVGYPPGGSTDIVARLIGQYLSEHLGQQFVIENKPGAGNTCQRQTCNRASCKPPHRKRHPRLPAEVLLLVAKARAYAASSLPHKGAKAQSRAAFRHLAGRRRGR